MKYSYFPWRVVCGENSCTKYIYKLLHLAPPAFYAYIPVDAGSSGLSTPLFQIMRGAPSAFYAYIPVDVGAPSASYAYIPDDAGGSIDFIGLQRLA
jgi:hypothetical protein